MGKEVREFNKEFVEEHHIKRNIAFRFMPISGNEEELEELPHRVLGDIALYYVIIVERSLEGVGSCKVNNDMMQVMELEEEGLFNLALENTEKLFPVSIEPMDNLLIRKGLLPEDVREKHGLPEDAEVTSPLIIISNESSLFGASAIMYRNVLRNIANNCKHNLYLLPRSVHEFLAMPAEEDIEIERLKSVVLDVNQNVLDAKDFLSNSIFYYDVNTAKLSSVG
jgi:hypothetical protein